jgi:membrane-associated phospholipid phosphatase
LDKPTRLPLWDKGQRLEACHIELTSGLNFPAPDPAKPATFTLTYANLAETTISNKVLVQLERPTDVIFRAQNTLVATYAGLRDDRGAEILAQTTPPIDFWGAVIGLQPHRHPWTLALLDLSFGLAVAIHMRFKHAFVCPRPSELSPQIQPMIPVPGHAAWPSGHATEAYLVATILQALMDAALPGNGSKYEQQLQRLAARIAVNRTVAGLHFPVDSAAGRLLGTVIGEFVIARCTGSAVQGRGFVGPKFQGAALPSGNAFEPLDFDPMLPIQGGPDYYEKLTQSPNVKLSTLLGFVWDQARDEWKLPI